MSNQGSRFDREFTPDDLAIVNMGYWDPNADEDSEQADSAPVEAVEAEISKPAEADAEPAEHEVAAAPLEAEIPEDAEVTEEAEVTAEAEVTEEAKEAEAAETVGDSAGSDISDSSEELQETASRESEESVTKPVAKSVKIPAGGPPPHPVWRSMPKPNSPRSRQSPAASKAPSKRSSPLPKRP